VCPIRYVAGAGYCARLAAELAKRFNSILRAEIEDGAAQEEWHALFQLLEYCNHAAALSQAEPIEAALRAALADDFWAAVVAPALAHADGAHAQAATAVVRALLGWLLREEMLPTEDDVWLQPRGCGREAQLEAHPVVAEAPGGGLDAVAARLDGLGAAGPAAAAAAEVSTALSGYNSNAVQ